jgi:hypothetical protein
MPTMGKFGRLTNAGAEPFPFVLFRREELFIKSPRSSG